MNTRSQIRRINAQQGRPVNYGLDGNEDNLKPRDHLKPCPFCGGKPFVSARLPYFGERATVAVVCENCNAASKHKIKEEEAIEAWNVRKGEGE